MFDARTAALLRGAPSLPGLDADNLPQALTRHYAALVSRRLRGADTSVGLPNDPWPVDRIADVYEIVASLNEDPEERRAAAFVAGTAQQIIARRIGVASKTVPLPVDRDGVDAGLAAALLFLAAEQYADANEAAGPLALPRSGMEEAREIGRHVRDFARGNLTAILDRAAAAPIGVSAADGPEVMAALGGGLEELALRLLLRQIGTGIEHLAAYVMSVN